MPSLVSASFLPDDVELGRESREARRRRRRAERREIRREREERRQARLDARARRRAEKRGDREGRREQVRVRRRRTIEDAGNVVDALDEATDDGGLLADYLPPGEFEDGEIEQLPVDASDGFGDERERWNPAARLGRIRIQSRRGTRAATIELRPGLYLVAEVAEGALAGIGGPVKLATKVVEAATHALQPRPLAVPAPAEGPPARTKPQRWRGEDTVGCASHHKCRCER